MRTPSAKSSRLILTLAMLLVLPPATLGASPFRDADQPGNRLAPAGSPAWRLPAAAPGPLPVAPAGPEAERTPPLAAPTLTLDCEPLTWVDYDWMPPSPKAGEPVTFTIISLLPPTATLPITFTWDFDDSHTGAGNPVTHTYAISGSYWVFVAATNPCSEVYMSHSLDVTSVPASEPDIDVSPTFGFSFMSWPDDTASDILAISNHPSATAVLNWVLTEDPAASWLDESATSGDVAPGDEDLIEVTVDTAGMVPGDFVTTTLVITSNDPDESPWTKTTVELYVQRRDVDAVTLAVTNAGRIYTDTIVTFSADIEPDKATKPYTYTIDYGAGQSLPSASSADPLVFTHTFAVTGSHTVTLNAWNWEFPGQVTDSVSVVVSAYDDRAVYLPVVLYDT